MSLLNATRQIYKKILSGGKPTKEHISDLIQASHDLKNLMDHPGWKRVEQFISNNKSGIGSVMEIGIQPNPKLEKSRIQVYDDLQTELKTYKKIETFINLTVRNGEEYERQLAKQSQPE